jgi:hypothetical protein
MAGETALVVASHTSTEEEDGVQVYEVGQAVLLQRLSVDAVGDYLSSHTHLLRVTSSLPAHVNPHHGTKEQLLANIPHSPPTFHIPSLHLLLPHSHKSHSSHPHKTLRQLLLEDKASHDSEACLPVEILEVHNIAGPLTVSLSSPFSSRAELDLPIDALAVVHLDLTLHAVGVVLWEAVQRQLHAVAMAMLWKAGSVYNVALHHFPPSPHHLSPISLPYPHTPVSSPTSPPLQDCDLVSVREAWHKALCLPLDVPMLRTTNAHLFSSRDRGHCCYGSGEVCILPLHARQLQ